MGFILSPYECVSPAQGADVLGGDHAGLDHRPAQLSLALAGAAAEQVALAALVALHLAGAGDPEPLLDALVRFRVFGHVRAALISNGSQTRQPLGGPTPL